jgi:hypothetical protein
MELWTVVHNVTLVTRVTCVKHFMLVRVLAFSVGLDRPVRLYPGKQHFNLRPNIKIGFRVRYFYVDIRESIFRLYSYLVLLITIIMFFEFLIKRTIRQWPVLRIRERGCLQSILSHKAALLCLTVYSVLQ